MADFEKQLKVYRTRLRRQLLLDIAQLQPVRGETFAEISEYYGFDFRPPALNLLVFTLVSRFPSEDKDRTKRAYQRASEVVAQNLLPHFHDGEVCITKDFLVCLINLDMKQDSPEVSLPTKYIDQCFAALCHDPQLGGFHIVLGDGIPVTDARELEACFHGAVDAMQHGILYGYDRRYDSSRMNLPGTQVTPDAQLSPSQLSELQSGLLSRDAEFLENWVHQVFQEFRAQMEAAPALAFLLPRNIMQRAAVLAGNRQGSQHLASSGDRLALCVTLEQEQAVIVDVFRQFCQERTGELSPGIATVRRYLSVHFRENTSLEELAAMAQLNPQYLSVRYRQETGETISQYVQRLRLAVAAQLLTETTQPIAQIAAQVGYQDGRYFSRVFQKAYHKTPSGYRK